MEYYLVNRVKHPYYGECYRQLDRYTRVTWIGEVIRCGSDYYTYGLNAYDNLDRAKQSRDYYTREFNIELEIITEKDLPRKRWY